MPRTDVRNDKDKGIGLDAEGEWRGGLGPGAAGPGDRRLSAKLPRARTHAPDPARHADARLRCSRSGGNSFLPPHPHAVSLSCCALPAHPASSPPVYRFARACVALWRFLVLSTTFRTRDLPTTTSCALNIRNSPLRRGGDGRLNRAANSSRDIDPAERVLEKTKREEKSCLRESGGRKKSPTTRVL